MGHASRGKSCCAGPRPPRHRTPRWTARPVHRGGGGGRDPHAVSPEGERIEAIDGMASWRCAVHGYRESGAGPRGRGTRSPSSPTLMSAASRTGPPWSSPSCGEETPPELQHVFFAGTPPGSVSVEVALSWPCSAGRPRAPGARRILAVRGGYRGRHGAVACATRGRDA
ncbi:hypothetical protein QJS66_16750 [Kocuria rhizophila]|nr:hypothetical protein QJS66_16750 [Kocuria rhizophila]